MGGSFNAYTLLPSPLWGPPLVTMRAREPHTNKVKRLPPRTPLSALSKSTIIAQHDNWREGSFPSQGQMQNVVGKKE